METKGQISVVIPCLNEREYLLQTVEQLRKAGENHIREIIVVDCRSSDGTKELAENLGCKTLSTDPGNKWRPLNLGAKKASAEILLFVDADTLLPDGYARAILQLLSDTKVVGGAFEFCLLERGFALRLVEVLARIRYRIWKRYYGDQAIFVRRSAFRECGGFPKRDILEASHFCESLSRLGKLKLLHLPAKTSARRFLQGGVFRVLCFDIRVWFLDLLGFCMDRHGKAYWLDAKS